jgi:hypothetical protein
LDTGDDGSCYVAAKRDVVDRLVDVGDRILEGDHGGERPRGCHTPPVRRTDKPYQRAATVTYDLDGRQHIALLSGTLSNTPPGRLLVFALDGKESLPGRPGS